jgi:hypothetical protein
MPYATARLVFCFILGIIQFRLPKLLFESDKNLSMAECTMNTLTQCRQGSTLFKGHRQLLKVTAFSKQQGWKR